MKSHLYILLICQLLFFERATSQVVVANSTNANGTYSTLKAAFDKINLYEQDGNKIVVTISSNTTETASATLYQSSSPWTSLKIIPSANVTISGNISGPLVSFDGADNVLIEGNNNGNSLTLENSNSSNSAATIKFVNDACRNKITNCIIKGSSTGDNNNTGYGGVVWFYTTTTSGNDNDTISNCDIGPSGANLPYMAIRGYGTSGKENDGIVIYKNTIHDFFCTTSTTGTEGVYVGLYNNAWIIQSNKFYQTTARTFTVASSEYRAIYITNTTTPGGAYLVDSNVIGYASSSASGTTTISGSSNMIRGIYIKTATSAAISTISNNTIAAFNQTTSRNGTTSTIGNSPFLAIAADASGIVAISGNTIGGTNGTGSVIINHNYNSFASSTPVAGIFTSGSSAYTISNNVIGGITINKASTLESLSFHGIKTEGTGAVTISSNTIGNSTASNITSNFTAGILAGIDIGNSSATITADGNTITNFYHSGNNAGQIAGINVTSTSGTINISNNTIADLTYNGNNTSYVVFGIQTAGSSTAIFHVTGNHISGLANTYTGAFGSSTIHGMYFGNTGTSGHTIVGNDIYDLTVATTGYVIATLVFDAGYTFTNNMLSVGLGLPENASIGCYGFYLLSYSYPAYFYYNSVYIGGNSTVGGNYNLAMNLCCLNSSSVLLNNIVINDRTTPTPNNDQPIYIGTSGSFSATMDHNNIYKNPAITYLIKKVSSGYSSLSTWQSAFGKDLNSISSPMTFVDKQFDLHLTTADCNIVSGKAAPVSGITIDIDNDSRSGVTPTIGADECNILLPIELVSFDAIVIDANHVLVSWLTESEINNDHFDLERSADGKLFSVIAQLEGGVNITSTSEYHFDDLNPLTGISYYRLKQVDADGSQNYSAWEAVQIIDESQFLIYPNPVNDILTISGTLNSENADAHLSLVNLMGKEIFSTSISSGSEFKLDVSFLPSGTYYLVMMDGSEIKQSRFVKQ